MLDPQPDLRDLGVNNPKPSVGDLVLTFGLANILSGNHSRLPLVETFVPGDGVLGHLDLSFSFLPLSMLPTQLQLEAINLIADVFVESFQSACDAKDFAAKQLELGHRNHFLPNELLGVIELLQGRFELTFQFSDRIRVRRRGRPRNGLRIGAITGWRWKRPDLPVIQHMPVIQQILQFADDSVHDILLASPEGLGFLELRG